MTVAVSYTGSVTRPAEIRTDPYGKPFLCFGTVADYVRLADEDATKIGVAYVGDDVEALAPRLVKHTEVYVEGCLGLWEASDGRTMLSVSAVRVEVLGQIGRVIGRIGGNK